MCDDKKKRNLFNYGKTVKAYKEERENLMERFHKDADAFSSVITEFKVNLFNDENNNSKQRQRKR